MPYYPSLNSSFYTVGGNLVRVAASELTRPSNVTPYTALDAVSNSTTAPSLPTFTNAARVTAGSGYIVKARLMTDQKTCTARFRLHLFHTAPTAINDNSPYTLLYANVLNRLGWIDFDALGTEDPTNSTAAATQNIDVRLAFVCASASRDLYGMLETRDAFPPASGQEFTVELTIDQN
jgi:hypothetical protein